VAPQTTQRRDERARFNGTNRGRGQTGSFTVTDGSATNSPQSGSVTVDVYDHAAPDLVTGTLTLGNVHVGYTSPLTSTNTLTVDDLADSGPTSREHRRDRQHLVGSVSV